MPQKKPSQNDIDRLFVIANTSINLSMTLYNILLTRFPECAADVEAARQFAMQPVSSKGAPAEMAKLLPEMNKALATTYATILQKHAERESRNDQTNKH